MGNCVINQQDCHRFCDLLNPWLYTTPTNSWTVLVVARAVWDYAKSDGTVIARNQLGVLLTMLFGGNLNSGEEITSY